MKIKKDDNVKIISGKYRGQEGRVIKIKKKQNQIIISNINLKTKHIRPKKEDETGTIKKIEAPIHISNVSLKNI
uniref:Large ribosomal subunit protein uL24c n=1 Tax=Antithamnion hubbsii TaxID=1005974 RepID=A0A4D6WQE9_9FLOR|nr:ribosomal protein L24 [Antithamnion hubbsii]